MTSNPSNSDIIEAFIHHKKANSNHLYTDGIIISSYDDYPSPKDRWEVIGLWKGNKVLITMNKFSALTSIHQAKLRHAISSNAIPFEDAPLEKVLKNALEIMARQVKKAEMKTNKARLEAEAKKPLTEEDREVLSEVNEEGNFLVPTDYKVEPFSSKRFEALEQKGYISGKLEPESNMKRYALTEKGRKSIAKRVRA